MGTEAPAIDAEWWADAAKPYAGVTIHGVTEATPPSNYVKDVLAPEFEKKTGIKVEFETTSWDQMYDKAIKDMEAKTGIYDFVYIEQDIIYAYLAATFLSTSRRRKENPKLKAPDFTIDHFTSFINYFKNADGDIFGVPMEAFVKVYLYRKDLFDDPKIKEAFKAKYGNDLAPAKTHEEYSDIAEFFTVGQGQRPGAVGHHGPGHPGHPASWYEFFESVAPTFGVYNWGINADKNYAASVANGGTMNSPEAKAALKYWLGTAQLRPAGVDLEHLGRGRGRPSPPAAPRRASSMARTPPGSPPTPASKVVGNVGVALPPLEPGVMEAAEAGKGYIGYYDGGAFGIPARQEQGSGAALPAVSSASPRSSPAGRSPRRASPTRHLRRSRRDGDGRQVDRRLLHAAAGQGQAVRRRPALSVPRPGPRSDRAVLLRGDHSASCTAQKRSTRWRPRPRTS